MPLPLLAFQLFANDPVRSFNIFLSLSNYYFSFILDIFLRVAFDS